MHVLIVYILTSQGLGTQLQKPCVETLACEDDLFILLDIVNKYLC